MAQRSAAHLGEGYAGERQDQAAWGQRHQVPAALDRGCQVYDQCRPAVTRLDTIDPALKKTIYHRQAGKEHGQVSIVLA